MNKNLIFISSCIENHTGMLKLIDNITDCNIPPENVHIIVGGADKDSVEYIKNIEVVYVQYRCFEFTPMIYIIKNKDKYDFEYSLFLHDTVYFTKDSWNAIVDTISELSKTQYSTRKAVYNKLKYPSMNIGIYSKDILFNVDVKNTLLELCCYSNLPNDLYALKSKLVNYEDFILNKNCYPPSTDDIEGPIIEEEIINIKNEKIKIWKRNIHKLKMFKIQTNFLTIKSIIPPFLESNV
jgi:hypothetical protein